MQGNVFAMKRFKFGGTKTWSQVNTITAPEQTVSAPGVRVGDIVIVQKPTYQTGLAYNAMARVDADGVLTVQFDNPTGGNITPTANEEWNGILFRAESYTPSDAMI